MEEEPPYIETVEQDPTDFSVFGPASLYAAVGPLISEANIVSGLKLNSLVNISRISFRDIFEDLIAKNQCKYVLDDKPRNENALCWLCGFTIGTFGYELSINGKNYWENRKPDSMADNAPECEHLIPASAAIMYFGLVESAKQVESQKAKDYFSLNYEWAHRICNGIKDHALFMDIRNPDGTYRQDVTINDTYITNYLTKLYNGCQEIKNLTGNRFDLWSQHRLNYIKHRLQPLQNSIRYQPRFNVLVGVTVIFENIDTLYDRFLKRLKDPRPIFKDQRFTNIELLEQMNSQIELYIKHTPRKRGGRKRTLSGKGGIDNNRK